MEILQLLKGLTVELIVTISAVVFAFARLEGKAAANAHKIKEQADRMDSLIKDHEELKSNHNDLSAQVKTDIAVLSEQMKNVDRNVEKVLERLNTFFFGEKNE